jgi:hypothetical protein
MDDAKQFVTLVLVLFVASGLLAAHGTSEGITQMESIILFLSALAITALIFPVTDALKSKATAGYELYIASAIHAAIVHSAVSLGNSHQWFAHVYRNIDEIQDGDANDIVGFELERHWKHVIINRWKESSGQKSGQKNLLKSFNELLGWSRKVAGAAICLGFCLMLIHNLSEPAKNKSKETSHHQKQDSAKK